MPTPLAFLFGFETMQAAINWPKNLFHQRFNLVFL